MVTLQNVISSARADLNDSDGVRYIDSQMLEYANDGIQEGFRFRPDFRLGKYTNPSVAYGLNDEVPFPAQYQMLLKHYVCARCDLRDDEYSQDGRAAALLGRFEKELKS